MQHPLPFAPPCPTVWIKFARSITTITSGPCSCPRSGMPQVHSTAGCADPYIGLGTTCFLIPWCAQELRVPLISLRAFNVEVAQVAEHAKQGPIMQMRFQARPCSGCSECGQMGYRLYRVMI